MSDFDLDRLANAERRVREHLLSLRNDTGCWTGQLSTSALSTATAVMALHQVAINRKSPSSEYAGLIDNGIQWLIQHQNDDGGWGDTIKSKSNISTSMLAHATLHACSPDQVDPSVMNRATVYIQEQGGVDGVLKRYGKDKTFSIPILTHCALAGLVDWKQISALPFELACLPHQFYAAIRLPVVSYALPALIAIGQVRHHFRKPYNILWSWLRDSLVPKSLRILKRIQPESGGFLEAAPLTSFVTMSLAAKGEADHPVARKGVQFLVDSVLEDGSWPIDTNLATWVTSLSVNAIGDELAESDRKPILTWLLDQQYKQVHPYTHAAPGGWAWTDLSGGVPDADDTPAAILAVLKLTPPSNDEEIREPILNAVRWLLDLQNRDGGWPTFCRGWGTLPFDRSSCDLTAHAIRALHAVQQRIETSPEIEQAIKEGFNYLNSQQRPNGTWLPLWFGNQHAPDDINSTYGTAKVIAAYRETDRLRALPAQDGIRWLRSNQNSDGGWGGIQGTPSSVEETALAVDSLICDRESMPQVTEGLQWLIDRVESATFDEAAPIGFYFAKLWYFERLYPIIFTAGALHRAVNDWTHQE